MSRLPAVLVSCAALASPALSAGLEARTPYHGALDIVAAPEEATLLQAWFQHSAGLQKSLEHAAVRAEMQVAGTWAPLGSTRTDEQGRAVLAVKVPNATGVYPVRWWFGTQSAECCVHAVGADQPATVFDIDGTLTISDAEGFRDYARRLARRQKAEGPRPRPGAVETARSAAALGLVVYLTGRPPWLAGPTREWLAFHGFPSGAVLFMAQTRDILPRDSRVGRAKLEQLKSLQAAGLRIRAVYGNAPTDIRAYAEAGIPKEVTFILGQHGGEAGTVALGDTFPMRTP